MKDMSNSVRFYSEFGGGLIYVIDRKRSTYNLLNFYYYKVFDTNF